ncbi:MAG: hypothetical protein ACT6R2_03330 [Blastomonas fulva]|uniref:hypothetical protein n=1 Tax=Blastomonas fulva TaxID=1550728 RepID=UPI004034C5A1
MSKLKFGSALAACAVLCAGTSAFAQQAGQPVPNIANYQELRKSFRIGIRVNNQLNGFDQSARFEQDTIDDIIDFLDPSVIATVVGFQNAQLGAVSGVFDIRGATAVAGYLQNSALLTVSIVSPTGQLVTQGNGAACTFTFNGINRQQAFNAFDAAVDDEGTPTSQALLGCLARSFTRFSPADPLAGNPGSLQAQLTRSALDLTNGDSLVEQDAQPEGANTPNDPWLIGATYNTGSAGRFDIGRVDARVQRSFRIFEGNRALLKFDLPFNYARINGIDSYSAQIGLGLEIPLIERKWSIEPRIGYGAVYSENAGSLGHILQGSITSRYVIDGIGRGRLIVGNMVGYGQTLDTPGTQANINPDLKNWSLRNGVAYDLPLKARLFSRGSSMRASYAFTQYFGSDLRNDSFHEATISFGIRGREDSVRATRDLIRINFSTIQARGYSTYSAGIGFRF